MPTTYTGDPVGAATPDIAPEPETAVVVNIPIATEGRTVSSIDQFVKALANNVAWLKKPKAKLSAWVGWILAFRTAGGHKRTIIDHLGFLMGRNVRWEEEWSRLGSASGTTPYAAAPGPIDSTASVFATVAAKMSLLSQDLGTASLGADLTAVKGSLATASGHADDVRLALLSLVGISPWRFRAVTAGAGSSTLSSNPPDSGTVQSRHRYVAIGAGDTLNDYALLYRVAPCNFDNDLHVVLEWEAQLEATGMGGKLTGCMGFCDENALPASVGGAANDYVVFEKGPSGNWFIRYRSGGGTAQGIDTTVAATTNWTRFRIELHGSTVAESAGRALRCYINGTQVGGDITTNVPVTTAKAAPHFSCTTTTGGASGLGIPVRLGPVRMAHNLYGSDVV